VIEAIERDIDNNPPLKTAVRKLLDTARKQTRLERQIPNE
jgi:hypothetical protein